VEILRPKENEGAKLVKHGSSKNRRFVCQADSTAAPVPGGLAFATQMSGPVSARFEVGSSSRDPPLAFDDVALLFPGGVQPKLHVLLFFRQAGRGPSFCVHALASPTRIASPPGQGALPFAGMPPESSLRRAAVLYAAVFF